MVVSNTGGRSPVASYNVSTEIIILKPITIRGYGGSSVASKQFPCIKAIGNNNIFKLKATLYNFMFSAYGITGVHIKDIMLEGPSLNSKVLYGICTDETINSGVYHVRNNTFNNVNMCYFDTGWKARGVCYLNTWNDCRALWCANGCVVDKVTGATEGGSDQNRFFGCEFVLNDRNLILSENAYAGSQTVVGCTLSEVLVGLVLGFKTTLEFSGNQIENNLYSGVSITIPCTVTNPNSEGTKHVSGNYFILNNIDISIDKKATAFAGGFAFPLKIEANTFSQTVDKVLYIKAPTGAKEFDSKQLIFCSSNGYSPAGGGLIGIVPDTKISDGWLGYNGYHEDGKVTASGRAIGGNPLNIIKLDIPEGKGCFISYNMASLPSNAADGYTPQPAGIRFTNAGSSSVIKEEIGNSGIVSLPRQSSITTVVVAIWANNTTNAATADVSYCIM